MTFSSISKTKYKNLSNAYDPSSYHPKNEKEIKETFRGGGLGGLNGAARLGGFHPPPFHPPPFHPYYPYNYVNPRIISANVVYPSYPYYPYYPYNNYYYDADNTDNTDNTDAMVPCFCQDENLLQSPNTQDKIQCFQNLNDNNKKDCGVCYPQNLCGSCNLNYSC